MGFAAVLWELGLAEHSSSGQAQDKLRARDNWRKEVGLGGVRVGREE